ncbi:hypothetical protein ELQ94_06600 [Labedella endophytica]|uniref:Histidine kinase/HSP90-like ATPase domain-containing protein n=2 Tax=Labedella endophytica TaxID=1523160 RepID=A0A433JT72_9MICO|nr:hypothetical protein ELQ94_06600 [Labedella endophytica]
MGIVAGITVIYVDHVSIENLVVNSVGLLAIAAALILGVTTVRHRADLADSTERSVRDLFERSQRQAALESERVRTDALLHDSVLATLSTAASGYGTPDQTLIMARTALEVVTGTADVPDKPSLRVTFERAVAAAEHELTPVQGAVRFDLSDASAVELPVDVAETLVAAMLQALNNSIKHAGQSVDRGATATRVGDDGISIDISDNGRGFDPAQIAPERLGVRASILERMTLIGGNAEIRSAPGSGTTVLLQWSPTSTAPPPDPRSIASMHVISRRVLYGTLAVIVAIAILTAAVQIALVSRAAGPLIATVLGLIILPTMVRGARMGTMRRSTAWIVTAVGWTICLVGTIGLDAEEYDSVSIACYTCGVLAGCVMGWMTGYRVPPILTTVILVVNVAVWAGPLGVVRLALAGEIVIVVAGLILHRAIQRVTEAARTAATKERETTLWQAELDAFQLERQKRLRLVSHDAAPMLRHIIRTGGALDQPARVQCRVLEQTLRDEIRGRLLLNDNVRSAILRHRRRGALVLLLDDGGLDDLSPTDREELLDDVARRIEPLRSSRIVIRTGQSHDTTAITIMASTPDDTAAALGLDDDSEVDLWAVIPRPVVADRIVAAAPH